MKDVMLWKRPVTVDQLNARNPGTIHVSLDIVFTEIGHDYLEA